MDRDINDYVLWLLNSPQDLKKEYVKFADRCYSLDGVDGVLSAELLQKVLQAAKRNRFWRAMLTDLLLYVDADSVTEQNFSALLRFGKKHRENYLSSLAHCELSFYQMQQISRKSAVAFEAFAWLFDRMCLSELFTVTDVEHLIAESPSLTDAGLAACIAAFQEAFGVPDGSAEKLAAAQRLCASRKKSV